MTHMVRCRAAMFGCFVAALSAVLLAQGCSSTASAPPGSGADLRIVQVDGLDVAATCGGSCIAPSFRLALLVATGDPASPRWSGPAQGPLTVEGGWKTEAGVLRREVRVTNRTSAPVPFLGLEWSTPAGSLDARFDRMLHNGYQSWSYVGIEALPNAIPDVLGTLPHGGDNEDVTAELRGVSWWWTALGDGTGRLLVVGADGGTVLKTYLGAEGSPARLRVVQGLTGDVITLAPGETKQLDGLVVVLGAASSTPALDVYAAVVSDTQHLKDRAAPLLGWGSWNLYYDKPTAPLLREELAWAKETLVPLGMTDFLLDDGYESHWGSWSSTAEFGVPLPSFNGELNAAGLRPAVWMAPFYVDTRDPLVTEHEGWFVHEPSKKLRTFVNTTGPVSAALDVTQPDARAWLGSALKALVAAGYRTLKIDFLFGAAIEGVRHEPITALESYQRFMRVVREATPGIHLVGCGAPLLPSVGWVDSMRTGSDIAFVVSRGPRYAYQSNQALHTALRANTDAFWHLDPDVVLLRGDDMNDAEAWTTVVSQALAGGNYLSGDGRQASEVRRAMMLDPELLAIATAGRAARPRDIDANLDPKLVPTPIVDVGDSAVPHLWELTTKSVHAVAVFGWRDGTTHTSEFAGFELVPPTSAGGRVQRTRIDKGSDVVVPPRAVRLFVEK